MVHVRLVEASHMAKLKMNGIRKYTLSPWKQDRIGEKMAFYEQIRYYVTVCKVYYTELAIFPLKYLLSLLLPELSVHHHLLLPQSICIALHTIYK